MSTRTIKIKPTTTWQEIFKDEGKWLSGLYVPEFTSREEIEYLEKHEAPELFYLIDGETVLVVKEDDEIREIPLKKDEVVIVNTWHTDYRPDGKKGICLVIERDGNPTEYTKL